MIMPPSNLNAIPARVGFSTAVSYPRWASKTTLITEALLD